MKRVVFVVALGLLLCSCSNKVAKTEGKPYGVNMACADFGSNFPGVYNTDYTYPQASDLDYWNEKGLKLVRFPFKWERLQYELNGELNRHDLDKMKDFVAAAAERGMVVMLDLHNYCRRYMNGEHTIIGTNGLTPEHLASFWKSLATEFKSFDNIYAYGLMNEPHDLDSCTTWFEMAQLCIDSIRTVDMDTRIMVGGDSWCSAERWLEYSDTLKYLKDPADKLAFEAHVYFDADASGTYKRGYDEDSCYLEKGIDRVRPFVEWLKANKFEGMVGEYGIPDSDSRWNLVLDKFLSYLQENDINGCYWAAGPWWPKDEFMAITPVDGKDRPQMEVVGKYLTTQNKINMPRHVFILFLAWIVPALVEVRADSWSGKSVDFSHGDLCVSPNGRFLQHTDGTPFLYLGDTAWELIYRLNEPEVELYMENRRAKGFTVIQTVILSSSMVRTGLTGH